MLLLLAACTGTIHSDDGKHTGGDTADTGGGEELGPFPDGGEVYDLGTPSFTVQAGGESWSAEGGYWSGAVATLRGEHAVDTKVVELVSVEIDGDPAVPGRYAVTQVEFVQQVAQSGDSFHYQARDPAGLRLVVSGFAEGDALFAESEGSAELVDTVTGGDLTLSGLVVESWPVY